MSAAPARVPGRRGSVRSQLVAAFVVSSLATLAAAALVQLPVLEHRLLSERLTDLRDLGSTARPALRAIPVRELRPGSPAVRRIADRLQRRTGGRVAIYDDRTLLVDTATARPGLSPGFVRDGAARAARDPHRVAAQRVGTNADVVSVVRDRGETLTLVITKRLDDTRAAASVVRGATPGALVAALVVALALSLLLSRGLSRRLARLHADARALGTEGLEHPVTVTGRDEIGVVAAALEDLRVRLREEEASRQAFVSTASHELRTPLASLQATLELLREEIERGTAARDTTLRRADTALRQTHRLVGLTTDLLDLSRVDGAAPLAPEPVEVLEVVRAVLPGLEDRLAAAGRAVAVTGGPAIAVADPGALARILGVLLDNACAYGEGAVTVDVGADPATRTVSVTVSDEGPGLSDDERERVFVRFTRGRAAGGKAGTGLGLAIARGLTHAMDGEIVAGPSRDGARFVVTLPAWAGDGAPADEPPAAGAPSDHGARTWP